MGMNSTNRISVATLPTYTEPGNVDTVHACSSIRLTASESVFVRPGERVRVATGVFLNRCGQWQTTAVAKAGNYDLNYGLELANDPTVEGTEVTLYVSNNNQVATSTVFDLLLDVLGGNREIAVLEEHLELDFFQNTIRIPEGQEIGTLILSR